MHQRSAFALQRDASSPNEFTIGCTIHSSVLNALKARCYQGFNRLQRVVSRNQVTAADGASSGCGEPKFVLEESVIDAAIGSSRSMQGWTETAC